MIFVTVGTQLPFDRLVTAMDRWAQANPEEAVLAQIGPSSLAPQHLDCRHFLDPRECRRLVSDAEIVVSHAGIGTILDALEHGRPLVVVPRRAALGEHRNDHQLATAERFSDTPGIDVAWRESDLWAALARCRTNAAEAPIGRFASEPLIGALREFITSV